jgi:hypothetical protein
LKIEYEKYDPSQLTCVLTAQHINPDDILPDGTSECHLIAQAPVEHPVRIWGIHGWRTDRSEIALNAFGVDIGCTDEPLPAGEDVSVIVQLNRGKVLRGKESPILHYDGTITHYEEARTKGSDEKEEIMWEDEGVKTEARILYRYEDTSVASNSALLQVACPSIRRWFKADGVTSLKQIIDRTDEDAREIARLLALCSREQIGWYEIEIETVNFNESPRLYPRAIRRGFLHKTESSDWLDPLIDHRHLIQGGFKRLLDAYRASKYQEAIKRVILFEVASRHAVGLESRYALCHMALEAIVNDLANQSGNAFALDKEIWGALQIELESSIKACGQKNGVEQQIIDNIARKISELRRVSLAEAVKREAEAMGVRVDDLWPSSIGFLSGLRQAIKLRNDLFHRASASDLDLLYENLTRLRILVERFILKVLGWPDEKIWAWHALEVERINKASETKP